LGPDELQELSALWGKLPAWRRLGLMEDVEELNESDTLLSFEPLARFALNDEDHRVRVVATRTLWDYEEPNLIPIFLNMLRSDPAADARAAAASALGRFVYLGELEEIPQKSLRQIEEVLLAVLRGQDEVDVRRAALESLGYSSREEVESLIRNAYASPDKQWKASALFAMGRSADSEWQPQIMEMLGSNLPLLRMEAARAAGELELHEATPLLVELLDDPDEATRQASIWSLSQVGGQGVMERLQRLYDKAETDGELELIETAIENLSFNESVPMIPLFDFPKGEEDEEEEDGADFDDDDEEEAWYKEYDLEDEDLYEDDDDEDPID
jgi:HEAT repeat protein